MEAAHEVVHGPGRPRPVDAAILPGQAGRVGREGVVLGPLAGSPRRDGADGVEQQVGPHRRQLPLDVGPGLVVANPPRRAREHRTCVHFADEADHGDAGLPFARDHGALYRRCAPVAREERGVHVDDAVAGRGEHVVGQNLPVGDDDAEVGAARREAGREARLARPFRLEQGNAVVEGRRLHGRRPEPLSPSPGAIRPRHRDHHALARRDEALERRHREVRGPEEGDLHHLPARRSLRTRRTICSRRRPCIRSTNSLPSRWSSSCWSTRASSVSPSMVISVPSRS